MFLLLCKNKYLRYTISKNFLILSSSILFIHVLFRPLFYKQKNYFLRLIFSSSLISGFENTPIRPIYGLNSSFSLCLKAFNSLAGFSISSFSLFCLYHGFSAISSRISFGGFFGCKVNSYLALAYTVLNFSLPFIYSNYSLSLIIDKPSHSLPSPISTSQ